MIRSQRTRQSKLARKSELGKTAVLPIESFQIELIKEIYRSDRRRRDREFGLVRLQLRKLSIEAFLETQAFESCLKRTRMIDSIGFYQDGLAFLLPDTDKDGSLSFANDITRCCIDHDCEVDTEVSVYPFDDELISLADEIRFPEDDQDNEPEDAVGSGRSIELSDGERLDGRHEGPGAGHFSTMVAEPVSSPVELKPLIEPKGAVKLTQHRFVPSLKTPWWKRAIDVVGAGTGLLLLSPVFLAAAIAIKCSSKGPVFFVQQREGKDGRHFGILKFRTMVVDAEAKQAELRDQSEQDGPAFKLTNDPRITGVGKYLRKSCVDELPQLFNVLTGDMSLVGPRPLPVSESLACKAWQRARLTVLPGLTCTWQAHGGRDVKFAQWMRMDLDYIERRSFWFDLKLIFETAFIALLHRGSV